MVAKMMTWSVGKKLIVFPKIVNLINSIAGWNNSVTNIAKKMMLNVSKMLLNNQITTSIANTMT